MMNLNWENCINPHRNEIVFENKNKSFGAYVIRRDYSKNTFIAFLLTCALTATFIIITFLNGYNPVTLASEITPGTIVQLTDVIFDVPKPKPEQTVVAQTIKSTGSLANAVIVKEPVITPVTPNSTEIANAIVGPVVSGPDLVVQTNSGSSTIESVDIPVLVPEVMPVFPGGEPALISYLLSNIKYPAKARRNEIEGKVYVSFIVGRDGIVTGIKLLHGIGGDCDEEAMRVVKNMPAWTPGKHGGQNVSVIFSLPVQFTLK